MAFTPGTLVQWSSSPVPPNPGLPQSWGYLTADTIATVQAADYFNLNIGLVIGRNSTWYVGDQVYCVCSDGITVVQIAVLTPNVTTTVSSSIVPSNSITTAMIQALAVTTAKLAANSVTLAKLASGITPSHIVKYAAQYTTVGGAAGEAITVTGALVSDLGFAVIKDNGTANVTLLQTAVTANTLTLTFSADPGADCIVYYQILRAAA